MAASDGGRSESSNDPAGTGAPTSQAPLAEATRSRPQIPWRSLPTTAVVGAMERAVEASTPSRVRAVRFALGVPVGLVVSMLASALLTAVYPLTAAMAFFLTVSMTMATGILFAAGFPLKDAFTTEERLRIERLRAIYGERTAAIDTRARRMQAHGVPGAEIEAALGPEWQRVRADFDRELAALGITSEASRPALSEGAPDPTRPPKK